MGPATTPLSRIQPDPGDEAENPMPDRGVAGSGQPGRKENPAKAGCRAKPDGQDPPGDLEFLPGAKRPPRCA